MHEHPNDGLQKQYGVLFGQRQRGPLFFNNTHHNLVKKIALNLLEEESNTTLLTVVYRLSDVAY